jgi:benzoyl-CoA reductase subunit B
MIAQNFERLAHANEKGEKVSYTFVPGNLNELVMCFNMVGNYPEINSLQHGMRKKTGPFIMEAEHSGHSEDVCTYVKSDIGMMRKGNVGPTGQPLPEPDLLLLSYRLLYLREMVRTVAPRIQVRDSHAARSLPGGWRNHRQHAQYVVKQLKEEVIPKLEKVSGVKFDIDRLREYLRESARAEDDLVWVLQSAKHKPSPIDAYFGASYYVGPIFSARAPETTTSTGCCA